MIAMVWYLTLDQVLIQHRDSKKANKKDDDNNNGRENPNYDFSIDNIRSIENKGNNSSTKPNQILCSICNANDKIVTKRIFTR
jgi:hypothetical protein